MRRKNPARKSAKKSGGSKIKIREKSVLPRAGPNILGTPFLAIWGDSLGQMRMAKVDICWAGVNLVHHSIATAIASDFLIAGEIARNFRSEKRIWPFFIAKSIATTTVSLPQRNRNLFPRKNRCVQFDRVNESQTSTANHRRETVHIGGEAKGRETPSVAGLHIPSPRCNRQASRPESTRL